VTSPDLFLEGSDTRTEKPEFLRAKRSGGGAGRKKFVVYDLAAGSGIVGGGEEQFFGGTKITLGGRKT